MSKQNVMVIVFQSAPKTYIYIYWDKSKSNLSIPANSGVELEAQTKSDGSACSFHHRKQENHVLVSSFHHIELEGGDT